MKRSQARVDCNKDDIISFAKKHFHHSDENSRWNGRQIYNAFKTAIALAEYEKQIEGGHGSDKPVLTSSHLRQVAHAAKKFDEYLLETQGGETISAMNQQRGVRADAFGIDNEPQRLKRRPTKNRMLDLDELPSTSDEDSEGSGNASVSTEEQSESEEEKKPKKKSRKSKKGSKKPVDSSSESSS